MRLKTPGRVLNEETVCDSVGHWNSLEPCIDYVEHGLASGAHRLLDVQMLLQLYPCIPQNR